MAAPVTADAGFDIDGARKAGYSDDQILTHLAQSTNFDLDSARKAGYSDQELLDHLSGPAPKPPNVQTTADQGKDILSRVGNAAADYTYRPLKHIWDVGAIPALEEMGTGVKQALDANAANPSFGNYVKAVPLIGPPAYDIGSRFASGDIAGGVTAAGALGLSSIAPELADAALPRVAGRILRPIRATEKPAVTAMKALGIPAGIAEQNGWLSRQVTRFLQNRALGREPMFNFLQGQNTAAQEAASRIGAGMGAESTPEETGIAIHNILNSDDAAATNSAIDAEAQRVGRVNADSQAQLRAGEVNTRDYQAQQQAYAAERAGNRAQSVGALNDAVNQIGDAHSPEATGQAFQAGINSNVEAFMGKARQLYSHLDDQLAVRLPDMAIDTGPISKFMFKLHKDLGGITGATAALKGADVSKLMDMASRWDSLPDKIGFRDGMEILSAFKSIGRESSDLINSRYPGVVKKLTSDLEAQMRATALKAGPKVLDAYTKANDFYKSGAELFRESAVPDLMNKNPEQVSRSLWKPNNITPVQQTEAALAGQPEAWQALRRRGMDDLFERSMSNGQLDANKLQAEWTKLGPDVQQALTGDRQGFDNLIQHNAEAHAGTELDELQQPPQLKPPPGAKPVTPQLSLTPAQQALRQMRPEVLASRLANPNTESLWRELRVATRDNPDLYDQARRNTFESLVAQHSSPPVGGGVPVLQSKALVSAWRKLGPQVQSHIAGDSLTQVNQLMSAVNALDTGKLNTLHNAIYGGLIDPSAGAFGLNALAHGDLKEAAATAFFLIAPRYIAKAITSPTGIKWLTEGLEIPAGGQAAADWARRGTKITGQAAWAATIAGPRQLPPPPPPTLPASPGR